MATITSTATGNWGTGATWVGGIAPVEGDYAVIAAGHIVTLDGVYIAGADLGILGVSVSGTLKASRSVSSQLTVKGNLIILNGGTLDFGKSSDPIPAAYTATLKLNYSATLSTAEYGIQANDGGNVYFYGAVKTINTVSTNDVAVGATTMNVADGVGWAVGDTLIFQETDGTYGHDDVRTISTITLISGTAYTVTFAATTYAHALGSHIGNMTSNVSLVPYNTAYHYKATFNHNTISTVGTREIQYTAFWYMSSTTGAGVDFINGGGKTTAVWTSLSNNMFYRQLSSGFSLYNFPQGLTITGCAFYSQDFLNIYIAQGTYVNFTDCIFYRASSTNIQSGYSQGGVGCVFTRCHLIDTNTRWFYGSPAIGFTFNDCTFHRATTEGFHNIAGMTLTFNRCSFSSSDLVGTPSTPILFTHSDNYLCPVIMNDCKFKTSFTSGLAYNISLANPSHSITIANKDVDPGVQEIYKQAGNIVRDNTSKVSGVTSLKMSPTSSVNALTFTMLIPAPTGKKVGVSGYLWRDTANVATVTLSGLGITDSVYTASGALSANEQFFVSGTQTTGTDGFLTLTISVIGTTGNMWVDAISAPQSAAIDFGEFGYWANGLPADIVTASYVSAGDVWNYLLTNITVAGSIGLQLKQYAKNVLRIG